MILTIAPKGTNLKIINISGKEQQKKQLSNLGIVVGSEIIVIEEVHDNIIVDIDGKRVVIAKELSNKIKVILD